MGKTLRPVSFWANDFKIGEVVEATRLDYFNLKSLKRLSKYRGNLSEILETGEFTFEFLRDGNREFVTFSQ